ncbi:uncharacterized protein LOC110832424 [Zootermopsis nevadensis]|uniref:Cuticle protein 6 n=1 Tax=Zootermopsis nevadensis TaxID=136037 RepID=A0A067RCZ0_ZOONE|nr:uncharacterized protein LOC110832424 [Zootermopsis nevadensis]KDR16643.1 Cuticle protein 6 [Zootermopsis nevadensis]
MQPRRPGRTSLRYIRDEGEVLRNSVASPSEDSTMSPLIVLCCIALATAKPSGFHSAFYSVPSYVVASPLSVSSQYHTQDPLGQYSYGYSAGSSAKAESKTLDGVIRGGYSYLDGNGVVQSANYVADDAHGFQIAATNVAVDTPEVAAAKAAHAAAYNEAAYASAAAPDADESIIVSAPVVSSYVASPPALSVVKEVPSKAFSYATLAISPAVSHVAAAPAVTSNAVSVVKDVSSNGFSYSTVSASPSISVVSAPAAVSYSVAAEKFPVVPVVNVRTVVAPATAYASTSHQYHTQDALGQYSYGYSGGPSSKVETKTLDGVTRGGYSYVDGNGIVQSARYVADDINGFRIAATNIPVGPESTVVSNVVVPPVAFDHQVVADTPEVVAARAAHFAAHAAVKYRDHYVY